MKTSVKTPLLGALRKAIRLAIEAESQKTTTEAVIRNEQERLISRRKFMEQTGKALAVTALVPAWLPAARASTGNPLAAGGISPRIAIIGGGIAGLNALHLLKKNGLEATVYESSGRTGGRMFTVQGVMGEGTWTEFGGEFIDTNHKDMWDLANEFKLELIDYAQPSEEKLTKEAFFFNGRHYTLSEAVEAFRKFAPRLVRDRARLPDDISYRTKNAVARKLDQTSLSDYLRRIGARGWIRRMIEVAYESEYGLSPKVQSCLNLLLLISPDTSKGHIEWFGESDERYKVRGGNQSIPDALAAKYTANIQLNSALEAIRRKGKVYELRFAGKAEAVEADYVILALPFTRLRSVRMQLSMPAIKRACINRLSFGTNAKLMLGMKNHFWRGKGYSGLVYSDNGIPNGWDNAQLQTPDEGPAGLSILFGGPAGVAVGKGMPDTQKDIFLPKWQQIYPGAAEAFTGKAARMHWPSHKHTLCSYICPTVGQYTSLVGAEQMPVGNVFFAGEHCGGEFAGFMNGAAKSGREAAEAILAKVKAAG